MLASKYGIEIEDKSDRNAGSPSAKSFQKSTASFIALSHKSPKKLKDGKIKNVKDTLFNPLK